MWFHTRAGELVVVNLNSQIGHFAEMTSAMISYTHTTILGVATIR